MPPSIKEVTDELPSIVLATRHYEQLLGAQLSLIPDDLHRKHELMSGSVFCFLRATFYRWAQCFPRVCTELMVAPVTLSVGDLHVENYGTWRDAEGRLIWGINDFDEALPLPYTHDLVRLATSAMLAVDEGDLQLSQRAACDALVEGYADSLATGGRPFVLAEHNRWLRDAMTSRLRDPGDYWKRMESSPAVTDVPEKIQALLRESMPEPHLKFEVLHRQAGLGSLGRPRFTAIADWRGGKIAREAKPLVTSAWVWANPSPKAPPIGYMTTVNGAVRTPDPFLQVRSDWVIRRLAPYCSRIELNQIPDDSDQEKLLRAMGFELANVSQSSPKMAQRIVADLNHRDEKWLLNAAKDMLRATHSDWEQWKQRKTIESGGK